MNPSSLALEAFLSQHQWTSHLSAAEIKYHGQGNLEKSLFRLTVQRDGVHGGGEVAGTGSWGLTSQPQAGGREGKPEVAEVFDATSGKVPLPNPPQTAPSTEKQVLST